MKIGVSPKNLCLLLILTTFFSVFAVFPQKSLASTVLMTAGSDKSSYYVGESVTVGGRLEKNGSPATNCLVGVEVEDQLGDPVLFRTISMGNPAPTPPLLWQLQISAVYVTNSSGTPTNSIVLGSELSLWAALHNNEEVQYSPFVTGTLFDGNLNPIATVSWQPDMLPGQDLLVGSSIAVPGWAYSGLALAVVNVYNKPPALGGFPIIPEAEYVFYLTRNSADSTPYSVLPSSASASPGNYNFTFRMSPDMYTRPGNYSAFATAMSPSDPSLTSSASTSFTLSQDPAPPSAAFTYSPLQVYDNMNVTFDASSSSAEGYNTTITQYAWTINAPNGTVIVNTVQTTPILVCTLVASGTYVVTLNVTNSAGLWCTAQKPVVVNPDFGPTANFVWKPSNPIANMTVTFDASSSQLGWSGTIPGYAPITSYRWNFSDGTSVITTSNSTITHAFNQPGNYTVILTVTDSLSRTSTTSQTVNVSKHLLEDINGDGVVDISDVAIVAAAYGTHGPNYPAPGDPASPNWDSPYDCDLNGDNVVDITDVAMVAAYFGWPYT